MVPIDRRKVSLYEEAKNELNSLVWQTATVFVGFIFMLLLTGGNPSGFIITLSFVLGIAFVVWREQNRFIKLRKYPDGSLDVIKKRRRPQNRNRGLRVIQVNEVGDAVVIGDYLNITNNNFSIDIAKSIASNQSRYKNYIAVPTKIFTDKNFTGRDFKFSVAQSSGLNLSSAPIVDSSTYKVLGQVSASSTIKTRLFELRTAIIEHENLTDKSKADAIGYLDAIAKISLQENETAS